MPRGRKLVVQMVESFRDKMEPTFVERLDAWPLMEEFGLDLPPVMVYGDDVTHLVTEEGIAHLHRCETLEERAQAIRNVAGYTPVGLARDRTAGENLRDRGMVQRPEDLGIDPRLATRDCWRHARSRTVLGSGGLYDPPKPSAPVNTMENLSFDIRPVPPRARALPTVLVVWSLRQHGGALRAGGARGACHEVHSSIRGFAATWEAVLGDFARRVQIPTCG